MKITAKIPAVTTFDLPSGDYRCKLIRTKPIQRQTAKGNQEWIRLVFEVNVPSLRNQYPCAGRNFVLDLNPGSDLRNFLESWLGRDYFITRSGQDLDFETLIGVEGDISLSHYEGANYDKPLVIIENIHPPGTIKVAAMPEPESSTTNK
ncbi:MAG: hypothetical protein WCS42_04915 [Verrucomicrobiota bacterium]